MSDQPDALRLADYLSLPHIDQRKAAAELRRQHSEIESLKADYEKLLQSGRQALEFWKALAAELPNRRDQIEALKAECDALKAQRQPLTDKQIDALELPESGTGTIRDLIRVIEAAHGIGGDV